MLMQSVPLLHSLLQGIEALPSALAGGTGVGKTALIHSVLHQQDAGGQAVPVMLSFSAQTTSAAAQQIIEARLEKQRRNRCKLLCCSCWGGKPVAKLAVGLSLSAAACMHMPHTSSIT